MVYITLQSLPYVLRFFSFPFCPSLLLYPTLHGIVDVLWCACQTCTSDHPVCRCFSSQRFLGNAPHYLSCLSGAVEGFQTLVKTWVIERKRRAGRIWGARRNDLWQRFGRTMLVGWLVVTRKIAGKLTAGCSVAGQMEDMLTWCSVIGRTQRIVSLGENLSVPSMQPSTESRLRSAFEALSRDDYSMNVGQAQQ